MKPSLIGSMLICFVIRNCEFQPLTVLFSFILKVVKVSSDFVLWVLHDKINRGRVANHGKEFHHALNVVEIISLITLGVSE